MAHDLRAFLQYFFDATARREADAVTACFHPNANLVLMSGETIHRRTEIEAHHRHAFSLLPPELSFEQTLLNIHFVTPDLAIIDAGGQTCRRNAFGEREVLSTEYFTLVALRETDTWSLATVRGALPPKTI